jgi:hypothetical protein
MKQEERVARMTHQSSFAREGVVGRRSSGHDYLFDLAPQNGCKAADPYG